MRGIGFGAIFLCSISVILQLGSCAFETASISRNWTFSAANTWIFEFDNQLYVLSKNQSHVQVHAHVNSSETGKVCEVGVVLEDPLEVTATEQEIFVVGLISLEKRQIKDYTLSERFQYRLLKLDPRTCEHKLISVAETTDSQRGYVFPSIVRHRNGSDLYYLRDLKKCAPCRLEQLGSSRTEQSEAQILPENPSPASSLQEARHVQYLDSEDAFFYVYDSIDYAVSERKTKLKILDSRHLTTSKQRDVDFAIDAISKQKNLSVGYLGVCTKIRDRQLADVTAFKQIRCERLSCKDLQTVSSLRIPIGDRSDLVSRVSYEFDQAGNSYISFAQSTKLRLYIHDKDGKLLKALDMAQVNDGFKQYPKYDPLYFSPYRYWDVKGFLVQDQYCIVTEQSPSSYSTPLHNVRCAHVQKYLPSNY